MAFSTLGRKRSSTVLPTESKPSDTSVIGNRGRFYSISSEIIPQTLIQQDDDTYLRLPRSTSSRAPSISQVGFQSIFQGGGQRRSKQSLLSLDSNSEKLLKPTRSFESGSVHINNINNSTSSNNNERETSTDGSSYKSTHTSTSSLKGKKQGSIFNKHRETTSSSEKANKLTRVSSNKSSNSVSTSLHSNKSNTLSKVARKLFRRKQNRQDGDDIVEQVIPSSLSKFLHPAYLRHRTQSQFIHSTNAIMDSGRSVYSFNPPTSGNANDSIMMLTNDDNLLSNNTMMLHDLLKNLPSLEANYKNFSVQELTVLTANVWGVYCSVIVELFKNKRLWQLPAKIEDINKVFEFYAFLKTDSKVASPHNTFLSEVEDFISSSLYILENQIIFNYSNENTMNTLLKRLGVVWQVFYQKVYYDVTAVLLPLEKSFKTHRKYWTLSPYLDLYDVLSVDHILLKCFRDCVVLPYYQNFIHSNDRVSKSFQMYIFSEEEENGVTDKDKLTLLQCFGILSTIQGNDKSQQIVEELLEGIRMSI